MSQIDQLRQLISDILQPNDQNLRKNSEATLLNLRDQKPNELFMAFLAILDNVQSSVEHRNFSATQIRLCLSKFSSATYSEAKTWTKLSPDVQQQIKFKLFENVFKEENFSMKKHIADCLGEIAGSVISDDDKNWPDFKTNVYKLFENNDINSNLAGFFILQSFFAYSPTYFDGSENDFFTLFKNSLMHENNKLKLAAIKSFAAYLETLQMKKQSKFHGLIIPLYEAVFILLKDKSDEDGLEALSEMLEVQPKFFKKHFKQLVELLKNIFKLPDMEGGVKRMCTQILVDYAERSPTLFRKKKQILESIVEMVFFHMIDISDKVAPQWATPKEGYNQDMQDDEDFETTRFGMGAIDRLIYTIGDDEMLPILSQAIEKLLTNSSDWRYKFTAVMALSQIGEYIEDPDKISSVLSMICGFLRHENPMLRYASCHAIGQISDDMQPKFQQKYGAQIFPQLLFILKNDSVPRVVSHSAASLTNFLEGMQYKDIEPQMGNMMELLIFHAINGISLVKQSALSAISSAVEIAEKKFEPYFAKTMEVLFGYFMTTNFNGKPYKQLKGQAIETMTIIASSVGTEMFDPAFQKMIELMINLQSSQFEQVDPQKSYILAGWQRMCLTYEKKLGKYLDRILPSLFVLVENVIKTQLELVNNPEPKEQTQINKITDDQNINTYQTEEAQVAISMLNIFIQQLKELFNPYVEKTVNLLCKIIKEHPNEDVKEQACKCLPNLIIAVRVESEATAVQMARLFMATLVETIEKQYETDIIIVELETLKNVLDELNLCFLTEVEVTQFSEKILNILKNSDQKKNTTSQEYQNEDIDEDEKQIIGEEIKQEEEVQVAISELIGSLFKTHKMLTIGIANYMISTILPKVFIEGQSQNMLKFGIFLIDDMVEHLGYELLPTHWQNFGKALMKYALQKSCVLRQASTYGLGIFAENTPSNVIDANTVNGWLNLLIESIKIQKGAEKEKTYGHCKDNGVASIGKIIKKHSMLIDPTPVLNIWLRFLPLKFDKGEGIIQHELLADIMLNKPEWIEGTDKTGNMKQVLAIYGDVVGNKKLFNEAVAVKLKQHIHKMQTDPYYQQSIGEIWGSLSDKHRENLTSFMQGK